MTEPKAQHPETQPRRDGPPCPKCGEHSVEMGFGLAGGGYGPYAYCIADDCGYFEKWPEHDDEGAAVMTSVPESVEGILGRLALEVALEVLASDRNATAPNYSAAIARAVSRLEALRPKAPMGGEVNPNLLELALAEFRGGLSATGTIAPISKASVSVILAALAQPKEEGGHTVIADGHGLAPDVAAPFSDEVVERMARAYDNASSGSAYWDTFDASPGSQTWAKWRDERLAAMRAALATLETKEKAGWELVSATVETYQRQALYALFWKRPVPPQEAGREG